MNNTPAQLPQSKYENRDDYKFPFGPIFGYTPFYVDKDPLKTCYYIHNFEIDKMLFGDGLPTGEDQAIDYCRIASRAWTLAKHYSLNNFKSNLEKITKELESDLNIHIEDCLFGSIKIK